MEGWISIHRKLQNNKLWTCEPFSRGQAWIDLLLLANYEYGFFYKRGVKVNIERGQVGWSELALSLRWKWSRSKVNKFLNDLEKEQQIVQQKSNVTQIVTILKYNEYQNKAQQKNTKRTPKEHQKDTNNKNNKNNKNNNIYRFFDHLEISNEENKKLLDLGYLQNQLDSVYDSIENYKKNTQYKSLYLTTIKWAEREYGKPKISNINSNSNHADYDDMIDKTWKLGQ